MNDSTLIETEEAQDSGFPVPFSLEQLRQDVMQVLLLHVRQTWFLFSRGDSQCLPEQKTLLSLSDDAGVNDPDFGPSDLGMRHDSLRSTSFAQVMEAVYQYAFHGIEDTGREAMLSDSEFTWCSVLVHDMAKSAFLAEWEGYNDLTPRTEHGGPVDRCLLALETAQARRILEGHDDNFMDWAGTLDGVLTMRQMALLSGMTEASVRTLSNPKRRNALVTVNDGKNVKIEPAAGKAWLLAKGRYLPIHRVNTSGMLDLEQQRFTILDDLEIALLQRIEHLVHQHGEAEIRQRLDGIRPGLVDPGRGLRLSISLSPEMAQDSHLMTALGTALDLPGPLLALRAAEAEARQRLAMLERSIQQQLSRKA